MLVEQCKFLVKKFMTARVVGTSIIALDSKWVSVYLVSLDIPIFHSLKVASSTKVFFAMK